MCIVPRASRDAPGIDVLERYLHRDVSPFILESIIALSSFGVLFRQVEYVYIMVL